MADSPSYNEKELLLRISLGDELAFKELFYAESPSLQKAIGRMTADDGQTQEIIQETFIRIWLSRDKLPVIENIQGYLYRTAVNFFVMHLRKQAAQKSREEKWETQRSSADLSGAEYVRILELKEVIANAINQLPEKRREIYKLSRDKGMTVAEIASHLQIAESTVKNSISSALASIRQHIINAGYGSIVEILVIVLSFFSAE